MKKLMMLSDGELKEAIDEILKLNPKPASTVEGNNTGSQYIIPDFIIYNRDGDLELSLNSKNARTFVSTTSIWRCLKVIEKLFRDAEPQNQKKKQFCLSNKK